MQVEKEKNEQTSQLEKFKQSSEKEKIRTKQSHEQEQNRLRQQLSESNTSLDSVQQQLNCERASNKKELANLKARHEEKLARVEADLADERDNTNDLEKEMIMLSRSKKEELSDLAQEKDQEISSLKVQLDKLNDRLQAAEKDKHQLLRQSQEEATKAAVGTSQELARLRQQNQDFKEENHTLQELIAKFKTKLGDLNQIKEYISESPQKVRASEKDSSNFFETEIQNKDKIEEDKQDVSVPKKAASNNEAKVLAPSWSRNNSKDGKANKDWRKTSNDWDFDDEKSPEIENKEPPNVELHDSEANERHYQTESSNEVDVGAQWGIDDEEERDSQKGSTEQGNTAGWGDNAVETTEAEKVGSRGHESVLEEQGWESQDRVSLNDPKPANSSSDHSGFDEQQQAHDRLSKEQEFSFDKGHRSLSHEQAESDECDKQDQVCSDVNDEVPVDEHRQEQGSEEEEGAQPDTIQVGAATQDEDKDVQDNEAEAAIDEHREVESDVDQTGEDPLQEKDDSDIDQQPGTNQSLPSSRGVSTAHVGAEGTHSEKNENKDSNPWQVDDYVYQQSEEHSSQKDRNSDRDYSEFSADKRHEASHSEVRSSSEQLSEQKIKSGDQSQEDKEDSVERIDSSEPDVATCKEEQQKDVNSGWDVVDDEKPLSGHRSDSECNLKTCQQSNHSSKADGELKEAASNFEKHQSDENSKDSGVVKDEESTPKGKSSAVLSLRR